MSDLAHLKTADVPAGGKTVSAVYPDQTVSIRVAPNSYLIALLLGGTLNATVGPRGAYVVAGVAGLVAVAVAAVRLRPHLRAGAPP